MKPIVQPPEPLLVNVGVYLRRRDIGMAKHRLDGTQVGAMLEEVGGKAVSQKMGMEIGDAGRDTVATKELPKTLPTQGPAVPIDEQSLVPSAYELWPHLSEVAPHPVLCRLSDRKSTRLNSSH